MRYRRVVVVGASGFVGRYVVRELAKTGATVAAVCRHAGEAGYLKPMGDVGQVALIDCDMADASRLRTILANAEAVINATGILFERGRQRFQKVHVDGPALLARLASETGAKAFIHVSAIAADPASPSAYGRSKAEGENLVRRNFPASVILRPSLIFGPEDAFFNRFAAIARFSPALPLIGGGATRFQPVYVGDVAEAVLAALERPESPGKIYELGGPQIFTLKELFTLLLKEIGRKRLLLPVPFGIAALHAAFHELLPLPQPLITRDQVRMLKRDAVAEPGAPGLEALGIVPSVLEPILASYLARFRRPNPATAATA
jgi:NADH dehydrogenase